MITSNVFSRVFFISINNDFGSSFSIEYKGEQYLVSAKHVFESLDFKNGSDVKVKIYHNKSWKDLICKIYTHSNIDVDIVVLKTTQVEFPKLPIKLGIEEVYLGKDIYFLGYPDGMFSNIENDFNWKFPIPFVKKGIISAIMNYYENVFSLFIDANNNKGFSGGPVIIENSNKEIQIIGVNVSYLKDFNVVEYEEQDDNGKLYEEKFEYFENSGIMDCHSIHHVFEIIDKI